MVHLARQETKGDKGHLGPRAYQDSQVIREPLELQAVLDSAFQGQPAQLDRQARVVQWAYRVPRAQLGPRDPRDSRARQGSLVPLVLLDHQVLLEPLAMVRRVKWVPQGFRGFLDLQGCPERMASRVGSGRKVPPDSLDLTETQGQVDHRGAQVNQVLADQTDHLDLLVLRGLLDRLAIPDLVYPDHREIRAPSVLQG